MFSHDFLVLNYRLEIRTADCRLEDMTANHTQPSTSYPCEDYDTTENVGLLEELQKVNYILISSTVLLLKPITVTVNPLLSAPLSNKPPFPSHLLFFNNKWQTVFINHNCKNYMWTDLGWFIHQLEVQICFWSSGAWPLLHLLVLELFHFVS